VTFFSLCKRTLFVAPSVWLLASLAGCPDDEDPPPPAPAWQLVGEAQPEAFLSVSGTSATDVWAVGGDGSAGPVVQHFDGTTWERRITGSRGDLWWVHAVSASSVYFGGENATVLHWDGTTFTRMRTPGVARNTVFGVWASSDSNIYAVGSTAGRSGFVWRFDGAAWSELRLPNDMPRLPNGEVAGLFKVWGDGDGTVWIVGARGALLRSAAGGPLEHVESGTDLTLFTVHGAGASVVAVGGAGNGVIVSGGASSAFSERTPDAAPLFQGVFLTATGGFASGARGDVYERAGNNWTLIDDGLDFRAESLHAVWVDPSGGVWSVGGNVLGAALDGGVIIHRGATVAALASVAPLDGGMPDMSVDGGPPPAPVCPEEVVMRAADKSIARQWNEQMLASIRRDTPRPTVHARNLFHVSAAMYDAWAAYDATADGYFVRERLTSTNVDAARTEAISYAAYRVLAHRYTQAIGGALSVACYRAAMDRLGYDPDDTNVTGDSPRALGNRIGAAVIAAGAADGANETMNYADLTPWMSPNTALVVDDPFTLATDPALWQPLNLAVAVTQNGIPEGGGVQGYIGSDWRAVTPFAMSRIGPGIPYHDAGLPPAFDDAIKSEVVDVIRRSSQLDPSDPTMMDTSPASLGNNSLGTNGGVGRAMNPVTSAPYTPQMVRRGDFGRVLAEFWADGPFSETPPGHWNVLANEVADDDDLVRQLGGVGPMLGPLEWDIKVYFTLNGAVHDAAITAWEVKRQFTCSRPITLVRHMAKLGQSTDTTADNYDANGLPLIPDLIEVVTAESSAVGERHARLSLYIGEVVLRSWRGEPGDRVNEIGGVGWVRGIEWQPYQRRTFVSPAFPGFISGHSTFSRAAAEAMTRLTGSALFPGGLHEFVARQNAYLVFERGPTTDVHLQWASYYDAADQAGQSRIWGSIHISPDDFVGRRIGSDVGADAHSLALTYFDGSAVP